MIVTIASAKGGVGKSTIAVHLAAEWLRRGERVLLVDADPQGTALTWSEVAAEAGHPAPAVVAIGDNLRQALPGLSQGYALTVIDTPGRQGKRMAGALALSDLVLLPCQPAPPDVWAAKEAVEAVEMTREVRPELLAFMVVNGVANTSLSRTALEAIAEVGLPALKAMLGRRVAFGEAMAAGQGVTVYAPQSAAAVEMSALCDEIDALRSSNGTPKRRKTRRGTQTSHQTKGT